MKHSPFGSSPHKTDTVARAADILRDRPMPKPKTDHRQNLGSKFNKPADKKPSEG